MSLLTSLFVGCPAELKDPARQSTRARRSETADIYRRRNKSAPVAEFLFQPENVDSRLAPASPQSREHGAFTTDIGQTACHAYSGSNSTSVSSLYLVVIEVYWPITDCDLQWRHMISINCTENSHLSLDYLLSMSLNDFHN